MKKFLILTLLLMTYNLARADHMAGGHFEYEYLGPNNYLITFFFFRDCEGIEVTPPHLYRSSESCEYTCVDLDEMTLVSFDEVDYGCGGTCYDPSDGLKGYELYIFEKEVTLPEECSDWRFAVNIGARNSVDYATGGNYFNYIQINNEGGVINDSPDFTDMSVTLGCLNQYSIFKNEHTDAEGDFVEFTLVKPQKQSASGVLCENSWVGYTPPDGFVMSAENPFPTTTGAFDLDITTGQFGYTPGIVGSSYFALRYREYRGGVLITESYRDGQILAQICPPNDDIEISNWNDTDYPFIEVERSGLACHDIVVTGTENLETVIIPNLPDGCTYTTSGIGTTTVTIEVCINYAEIEANCEDLVLNLDVVAATGGCFQNSQKSKNFQIVIEAVTYCATNRFFTDRNPDSGVIMPNYAIASERIWVGDDMPAISGIDPADMGAVEVYEDLTLIAGVEIIIPACETGDGCVTFSTGVNQTLIIQPNSCDEDCPHEPLLLDAIQYFECGAEKIVTNIVGGTPPYSYVWRDGDGELLSTSAHLDVHEIVSELEWDTPLIVSLKVEDAAGALGEWDGEVHGTKRFYEPVTNNTIWFDYTEDDIFEAGYYYAGQPGVDYTRPFFIADSVNTSPPWYGATRIELYVWDRWDAALGTGGAITANLYDNTWDINGGTDWSIDNAEVYWNGHWNNNLDEPCPGGAPEIYVYAVAATNCATAAMYPDDWRHYEISALVKFDCFDGDWSPSIDYTMAPLTEGDTDTSPSASRNLPSNSIDDLLSKEVWLFPNPTNEAFYLRGNFDEVDEVQIFDMAGNLVKTINQNFNSISVSEISKGSYIVKIKMKDKSFYEKLIIQ